MKKFLPLLLTLCLLLCGCTFEYVPPTDPTAAATSHLGSDLLIHFIDVGQADCILLECDGIISVTANKRVAPCCK